MTGRHWLVLIASALLPACPRPAVHHPLEAAEAPTGALIAALELPFEPDQLPAIDSALASLAERAERGDVEAAWGRAHYLLDLFDDARFAPGDDSLALLHTALGGAGEPRRGTEATDAALAGLMAELDRVLRIDRLHARAQAARTVLELEHDPPTSRAGLLQRMREIKAVAAAGGPLADNARLRLEGHCTAALMDAVRARWAERPRIIAHCLYSLYDADPEPYFAEDVEMRPPAPRWRDLTAELGQLAQLIAQSSSRLARAGAAASAELDALVAAHAADLPSLPELGPLGLAAAAHARPYDYTPLVTIGSGEGLAALRNIDALAQAVAGDGRRTLAVALARSAAGQLLIDAAGAARSAGAARLELAVVMTQSLRAPPADYWATRLPASTDGRPDNQIARLGVISLALAPFAAPAAPGAGPAPTATAAAGAAGVPATGERGPGWDPERAALGLHLVVRRSGWQLTSPTGQVAVFAVDGGGREVEALRAMLARIHAAFPDEDALVLVPGRGATTGDLVRAADAARYDGQGRELMSRLGVSAQAPAPRTSTLARRIERRARARVEITPAALAPRSSVLRRCYQDLLESKPGSRGRFRLELDRRRARPPMTVTITALDSQSPRSAGEAQLRRCVDSAIGPAMISGDMASAEAVLTLE